MADARSVDEDAKSVEAWVAKDEAADTVEAMIALEFTRVVVWASAQPVGDTNKPMAVPQTVMFCC